MKALSVASSVAVCLACCAGVAVADGGPAATGDHLVKRSHGAMGTLVEIQIWTDDDAGAARAIEAGFAELDRIDRLMTTWQETSDVSRLNAAAGDGKPVVLAPEVIEVLEKALDASRRSGGAFDVTVGAFQGIWKFDEDRDGTLPDPQAVQAARKLVGWKDLIVDPRRRTARLRRAGQRVTLGGIAKGYGVDRAVALLHKAGFVDFIVKAGGDMFVAGHKGERRWRVGIRDPRGPADDYFAYAEVEDRTFSTSGDYERFVVKDGRRYHHILDPRTGEPASACRSVTVMAKDALTADRFAKALFILGPTKGAALAQKLGLDAVFVGNDNKVTTTPGLAGKLTIVHPPTDGI